MFTFGPTSRGGESDSLWAYVVSLLRFEGTAGTETWTDDKGIVWVANGSTHALLSSTKKKFGSTSMRVTGAGTYEGIRNNASTIKVHGNGVATDFCIEFFVNLDAVAATVGLAAHVSAASPNDWSIEAVASTLRVRLVGTANVIIAAAGTLVANTWHHIALTRANGTMRLFLDGALLGSVAYASSDDSGQLGFGHMPNGSSPMTGYIDEMRVTKGAIGSGAARYTSGFTPPATPYPAG